MRRIGLLWVLCFLGSSASSRVRAADDAAPIAKIDAAISRAIQFLADKQSPDGAWRSDVYAQFKDGDALTPLVLTALLPLPQNATTSAASEAGLNYLATLSKQTFDNPDGVKALAYPVYTAANITLALHQWRRAEDDVARARWVQFLRDLQLTEATGWKPDDVEYGGWTYGHAAAKKPADGQLLETLDQPNMSATVFALTALRASGIGTGAPEIKRARRFVETCQSMESPPKGGFFFIHGDDVRNKAGVWKDEEGNPSPRPYGSATADGLRALIACGSDGTALRTEAASFWLVFNWTHKWHPGPFDTNQQQARDGLYYYFQASSAKAFAELKIDVLSYIDTVRGWRSELAEEMFRRQQSDGSWKNEIVDQRENDPLVATSFVIQALTACRAMLVAKVRPVVVQSADGSVTCAARDAVCHGEKLQYEPLPQKNTLGYWVNEKDFATWKLTFDQLGEFEVIILQGCGGGQGGSEAVVQLDGEQDAKFTVEETGHFQNFKSRSLGKLKIATAGTHELAIKALSKAHAAVMDVRQIRLLPAARK